MPGTVRVDRYGYSQLYADSIRIPAVNPDQSGNAISFR